MRVAFPAVALLLLALAPAPPVAAQEAVVHAILFYSPTCPHCHEVINNQLPPLRERYGDAFVVVGVDVTTPRGQELYQATVAYFALPESRLGVPTMVVGMNVMVGSLEIPQQLPGLLERGLATGGIDWPPVEAVRQVLADQGLLRPAPQPPTEAPEAVQDTGSTAPAPEPTGADTQAAGPGSTPDSPATAPADTIATLPGEAPVAVPLDGDTALPLPATSPFGRFLQDPVANGVAVAVLLVLLAVLVWSTRMALGHGVPPRPLPGPLFPALAMVGLAVAAYLSFVEVTGTAAVCGPVGDCNTVQQSSYAHLFGVVPVGVFGLAGYVALLVAWGVGRRAAHPLAFRARAATWGMAWVGTAFSAWLTFLEPFVIGATCAWCVSSALIMALLLGGATGELRRDEG